MIVYDLFGNYIEAAADLGVDADYAAKITKMRSKLLAPKIGKWGQLQEWETDRDDAKNKHRHVSHLFGVHPGRQIIPGRDDKLAKAAVISLNARGDGGTGWSKAWKISFWARLRDGNRSYKLMNEHIVNNFYNNLFDFHPPFQIDGNFGHAAGVAECLLQSHQRNDDAAAQSPWVVELLPSLPSTWSEGSVKGLRARGGINVDMQWSGGKLTHAMITANRNTSAVIQFGEVKKRVKLKKGVPTPF